MNSKEERFFVRTTKNKYMALVQIPEKIKPGFSALFELELEARNELVRYVYNAQSGTLFETLIDNIPESIHGDKLKLQMAIATLLSLYDAYRYSDLENSKFVEELVSSLVKEEMIPSSEVPHVSNLFIELLSNGSNRDFTVKLRDLVTDRASIFHDTRILTDVRPVFSEDESENVLGAAIIHTLKIEYHNSDGKKEAYIALDSQDLEKLKKSIIRAEAKEKSLRNELGKTETLQIFDLK